LVFLRILLRGGERYPDGVLGEILRIISVSYLK
jgi:hypothetical protein